jgi:hypothetical protein
MEIEVPERKPPEKIPGGWRTGKKILEFALSHFKDR